MANAVVAHNTGRLDKKLWTESPNGAKVQLIVAPGPREEGVRVADAIQRLRRLGIPFAEMAIIYRTNAIARHFEGALRTARIPHKVVGGKKFYERREVRDTLAYLRLVVNPGDDAAFLRVVNVPPRGVGTKTQADLRTDAAKAGQPLLSTARTRGAGRSAGEKGVAEFVGIVDGLAARARELQLGELVAEVIEKSGYKAMLREDKDKHGDPVPEAAERLKNLEALVTDARASIEAPGAAPMDDLVSWLDRIALSADADEIPEGGEVTLMTVHSSKGLEFPVVFVVQMNEGVFPHERSAETGLDEERRLAYVAFTRAMQRLIVTRSLKDIQGDPISPSRFLYGVPEEVLDGDLPAGPATVGEREQRVVEAEQTSRKLSAFLEHRRARAEAAAPEGYHTLIEVESLDQLVPGVQILHPRHGLGQIRHVVGRTLRVAFGDRVHPVPIDSTLRIVAD